MAKKKKHKTMKDMYIEMLKESDYAIDECDLEEIADEMITIREEQRRKDILELIVLLIQNGIAVPEKILLRYVKTDRPFGENLSGIDDLPF